ncbi:MAG: 3'-5' exonuclease [Bdellovibrionaceae bacterium]|nr:3'-5' exonuclease [Bdellovibrio sp.]
MRFIAFDLETTGTVPGVDQIVEIGAVRFNAGVVESVFATLIDPMRSIPPGATAVNRITDQMVQGKPRIETILASFAEFCEDSIMVAHNAPFDAQFLTCDIKKFESAAPRGLILDTLPISRKVFPGIPNYKLGTIVQHLKIPTTGFHRAEEDATYCGQIFLELIKRISIGGKPPQIENLLALTGKPELHFPQIERQPKQMGFLF